MKLFIMQFSPLTKTDTSHNYEHTVLGTSASFVAVYDLVERREHKP
jgi:hypothetical protein